MNSNQKELFESYSNLSYNVCGFIALIFFNDVLFCFAMNALGVASFTYHYNKTSNRNLNVIWKFDWWAMNALNLVVAGSHWDNIYVWIGLFLYHVVYGYILIGRLNVYLDVALSAVIALGTILILKSFPTFAIIIVVFISAVALRSKDEDPKQLKFHDSVWHSIWHILTGPMYLLAMYLDI